MFTQQLEQHYSYNKSSPHSSPHKTKKVPYDFRHAGFFLLSSTTTNQQQL